MSAKSRILVLNGPNLNLLGLREPTHYGHSTLAQVVDALTKQAHNAGVELEHLQSNREYELIEAIHAAYGKIDFIIINPAAFTHTSVALRDNLNEALKLFFKVRLNQQLKKQEALNNIDIKQLDRTERDLLRHSLHVVKKFKQFLGFHYQIRD